MEKLSKWKFLIKGPSRGMVGIMRRAAWLGVGREGGDKAWGPRRLGWFEQRSVGGGCLILGGDDGIV
jgi:hypothetical protein